MRVSRKTVSISAFVIFFLGAFSVVAIAWPDAPTAADMLANAALCGEINKEWDNSQAGDKDKRHEEGGWIVQCRKMNEQTHEYEYSYHIEPVPSGTRDGLSPGTPPDVGDDCRVVGFKHTHPNPPTDEDGTKWYQGPSEADKKWHERHGIPGIIRNADGSVSFGPASGTYK